MENNQMSPFKTKEKIGDMMKYGKPAIRNFPRRERKLADEIHQSMLNLYHQAIIVEKRYYQKGNRLSALQDLDCELAYLKHLIRMASDADYYKTGTNPTAPPLSLRQYEIWSKMLVEIGCMIGGYMKAI